MLTRYVLKTIVAPFIAWTGFLCVLFMLMAFLKGIDVLLGSGAQFVDLILIFAFLLPQFVMQTTPIAFLLGTLIGFGRLSEDSELKAMQSLGFSPRQLVWAPVMLGAVLTLVLGVVSATLQPWGVRAVRLTAQRLIRENALHDVKPGQFHQGLAGLTLYIEGAHDGLWSHVLLFDDRVANRSLLTVAQEGEVPPAEADAAGVEFRLKNGEVHQANTGGAASITSFEKGTIRAAIGEGGGKLGSFRFMREEMTPWELVRTAREARERGESDVSQQATLHERLRQVLMPLAFAMLGASLSLLRRDGSRATGIAITMGAYMAYYLLSRSLQSLGEQGRLMPLLAGLLPNLMAAVLSLLAVWWLNRRGAA